MASDLCVTTKQGIPPSCPEVMVLGSDPRVISPAPREPTGTRVCTLLRVQRSHRRVTQSLRSQQAALADLTEVTDIGVMLCRRVKPSHEFSTLSVGFGGLRTVDMRTVPRSLGWGDRARWGRDVAGGLLPGDAPGTLPRGDRVSANLLNTGKAGSALGGCACSAGGCVPQLSDGVHEQLFAEPSRLYSQTLSCPHTGLCSGWWDLPAWQLQGGAPWSDAGGTQALPPEACPPGGGSPLPS